MKNNIGEFWCVGDVHGNNKALLECLEAVNFDYDRDLLLSIGDLVDRGPESYMVAETLLKIKNKVLIQGNHDQWFKDFCLFNKFGEKAHQHPQYYMWAQQGGFETINSYIVQGGMNAATGDFKRRREHQALYASQIPYHVVDGICFVHGGFDRSRPIHTQDATSLCWDRTFVDEMMSCTGSQRLKTADGFALTIIGHTPTIYWKVDKPIHRGGVWNIDTGCGKSGKLTLMNVRTQEYYQTKDKY